MNTLFPIFLNLQEQPCTVIGGGTVALRKILGLLECHAVVRVVSPGSIPQILQLAREKKITLHERAYHPQDIEDSLLVVAATDDVEVNKHISQECTKRHILCNIVDTPELCSFYYGSVYTCGDLKIAISTNGVAPFLARKIKAELAESYPEILFTPYLQYLQGIREAVKEKIPEETQRRIIFKRIVDDPDLFERCQDECFHQQLTNLDFRKEVDKWL